MCPQRIRRRRTFGWRKPEGSVIVDRTSRFGNPFPVKPLHDTAARQEAVDQFTRWLVEAMGPAIITLPNGRAIDREWILANLHQLAGKDLCCPCPDTPCHAEVLLRLANT